MAPSMQFEEKGHRMPTGGLLNLYAQKNTKFEFSLLSWVSHAINISKQTHQTFPNSLCKRPNHTSAKVPQNPQGSQNLPLDITFLILQLLLQNFDLEGRFEKLVHQGT